MDAEQAYLFAHAVSRDAAYQLQLPADRARLHGWALDILEAHPGSGALAVDLAHHAAFAQSGAEGEALTGLQRRELRYLQEGAAHCTSEYDLSQAVRLYRRVLDHPLADGAQRDAALIEGTRVLLNAGKGTEALDWIAHGPPASDPAAGLAIEDARAAALLSLGRSREALECCNRALQALPESGGRLEGGLLSTAGAIWSDLGDIDAALHALERAARLADELQDPSLRAQALSNQARTWFSRGRWADAAPLFRQVQQIAFASGDRHRLCVSTSGLGACLIQTGNLDEAEQQLLATVRIAREIGNFREEAVAFTNLGTVEEWRGNLARAAELHERALQMHRETGNRRAEAITQRNLANLAAHTGRFAEAERMVLRAFALSREIGDAAAEGALYTVLATIHYRQGRTLGCLAACERASEALQHAGDLWLRAASDAYRALTLGACTRNREALEAVQSALPRLQPPTAPRLLVEFGFAIRAQVLVGIAIEQRLVRREDAGQALRDAALSLDELESHAHHAADPVTCREYVLQARGWLAQTDRGEWPQCWMGSRINELPAPLRLAVLDSMPVQSPGLLERLQTEAPLLLAALKDGTEELPVPDWRNAEVP